MVEALKFFDMPDVSYEDGERQEHRKSLEFWCKHLQIDARVCRIKFKETIFPRLKKHSKGKLHGSFYHDNI